MQSRQEAAPGAVAKFLYENDEDLFSISASELKALTARYDVDYSEHIDIMREIYKKYLMATLAWPKARMTESADLVALAGVLGLDGQEVANAHCAAAQEVGK